MAKVWEIDNLYEMYYQDYSKACRRSEEDLSQEFIEGLDDLRRIVDKYRIAYSIYADRCVRAGEMPLSWTAWAGITDVDDNEKKDDELDQLLSD